MKKKWYQQPVLLLVTLVLGLMGNVMVQSDDTSSTSDQSTIASATTSSSTTSDTSADLTVQPSSSEDDSGSFSSSSGVDASDAVTSSSSQDSDISNSEVPASTTIPSTSSSVVSLPSTETQTESAQGNVAVYRLYHPITGEHLYTTDVNEKNVLYNKQGWGYEGVAWYAPATGIPVYRLYNPIVNNHLYTSDQNEIRILTSQHGWRSDNNGRAVFYSGGSISIYRLYNAKLQGLHHWTTDSNEYAILPRHGWSQEGAQFKGVQKGNPIQTQYAADEAIAAHIKGLGGYTLSAKTKRDLVAAIRSFSKYQYSIGFIMVDVHTQKGIEYNADQQFYAASTVKGPYVASLAAKNPASIAESGDIMRQVLNYSSNEGYLYLVNRYHFTSWYPWLSEAGVRQSIGNDLYPYYSARELYKLWQRNYTYFTNDKTGQQVGLWYENPNYSPIHSVLGGQYRTRTKAGWIGEVGYHSASDAGIVYAKSGPYILAIMTDADANLPMLNSTVSALNTMIQALNEIHKESTSVEE